MPFTLGAPLGPAGGIDPPEPGAQGDPQPIQGEVAATLAPPPTTRRITDDPAAGRPLHELPRRRTPIVPAARRSTPPPALAVREPGTTLDYPLSEPALWPYAFDPDYGRPRSAERAAGARRHADTPTPDPAWVQRHRTGLVIAFGIVPFLAVPMIALLGTQAARVVLDLQVPQMSYFLDWVIVGAVATVAATAIAMRYVFRRRGAREPAPAVAFDTVSQES